MFEHWIFGCEGEGKVFLYLCIVTLLFIDFFSSSEILRPSEFYVRCDCTGGTAHATPLGYSVAQVIRGERESQRGCLNYRLVSFPFACGFDELDRRY